MSPNEFKYDPDFLSFVDDIVAIAKRAEKFLPHFEQRGHLHNLVDPLVRVMNDVRDFLPGGEQNIDDAVRSLQDTASSLIDAFLRAEEVAHALRQRGG